LVELDSLENRVLVRIRYTADDRTRSMLMKPGDATGLELDDKSFLLLLESIKGPRAFFVVLDRAA
jgi:hypothetical protein